MDGPRDYHTTQSQSEGERHILHDITSMWNVKYTTNHLQNSRLVVAEWGDG